MINNELKIKRVCGFYVNEWHLTTMILPYIVKRLEKGDKLVNVFQYDIKNNIKELLSKMNINAKTEKRLLEINWTSNNIENISKKCEVQIIIAGEFDYVAKENQKIQPAVRDVKDREITIINLYKIVDNKNISDILDENEYVINTSGIKRIEEVFTEYKKTNVM